MRSKTHTEDHAFTLLEIMLSVAVLAMVTLSIYRFVDTMLDGVRLSKEYDAHVTEEGAFERFFRAQIAALPPRVDSLAGEALRFSGVQMDTIRWYAQPGFGAMTLHARGEQLVTLMAQDSETNGPLEIGLMRQDAEGKHEGGWYPLLGGVKALEIRYFVAGSQEWMEKWTDQLNRPALVRLRYWRGEQTEPVEMVVKVPEVSSQALAGQLVQEVQLSTPGGGGQGGGEGRRGGSPEGRDRGGSRPERATPGGGRQP